MDNLRYFNWQEVEKDGWEKAYENIRGDFLYIEDRFEGQTEISDWLEPRYELKERKYLRPEDETIHGSHDFSEVEAYLEYMASDFEE